jgi:hypothetical protein
MSSDSQTIARRATAGGTLVVTTWLGTMPVSRSNHHSDMAVRMRPLSGIGVGSTQSYAEIRSLATNSIRPSGVSNRSRTLPEYTWRYPSGSS